MKILPTPAYQVCKASGQASIELAGKTFYPGRHASPESIAEYLV